MKKQASLLLRQVMKKRSKVSALIDRLALRLHRDYENWDYNFETNGEFNALRQLAQIPDINVVFDVGANRGEWLSTASQLFPNASIYAFEIVPQTFDELNQNCQGNPNINLYNIGLSDREGETTVFVSPIYSGLSTCVPDFSRDFHNLDTMPVQGKLTTGDRFCQEYQIPQIDFLKIDVEGLEDKVLKGFEGMLRSRNIRVIQFEYGNINISTHFLLKDFHDYLEPLGMKVGKIYPDYVDFRAYQYSDENFYGPNYLAVHSSCTDILRRLGK
jgi:FkbM family methyltransferase